MIIKCANCLEYIELPDEMAGTATACMLCGIVMMVPRPHSDMDRDVDLDLRPVDEVEEKRAQGVLDDMHRKAVAQLGTEVTNILRSERVPDKAKASHVDEGCEDVEGLVIDWLLFNHDGEEEQAASAVAKLRGKEGDAKAVLARLTLGILDGTSLVELDTDVFNQMKQKLRVKLDSAGVVAEGKFGK